MNDIQVGHSQDVQPRVHNFGNGTKSCSLCGRDGDLQESHIIPKFVIKWLKNTSTTGAVLDLTPQRRMYSDDQKITANQHAKIVQDLPTCDLLCGECEQRFSRLERQFAENIFYKFHDRGAKRFEYGEWLEPFAVSLAWRILKFGHGLFKSRYPDLITYVEQAETAWRKSLLGDTWTAPPYESNILFLDDVAGTGAAPEKFDWYMLRSIEYGIECHFGRVFVYAKLPSMVLVTAILPDVLKDWQGTRIEQNGVITGQHRVKAGSQFWKYLLTRDYSNGGWLDAPVPLVSQDVLLKRQQRALQKDPKRFLESDTMKIATCQMISRYKKKMANMPKSIIELVNVIGNQVAGTRAETVDSIWRSRMILDALAGLSWEEATAFERGAKKAICQLYATGRSMEYRLRTDTIWLTFIANRNWSKADQRAVITKELTRIEIDRSSHDAPVAIFSMNYDDYGGVSFEFGFLISPEISQ